MGIGILRWAQRHYAVIGVFSGAALIGIGVLLLTERWYHINLWFQKLYYGVIG